MYSSEYRQYRSCESWETQSGQFHTGIYGYQAICKQLENRDYLVASVE